MTDTKARGHVDDVINRMTGDPWNGTMSSHVILFSAHNWGI